jgi:hypothetical protein
MSTADLPNRGCRRRRENAVVPVYRFTDEARFATPTLRRLRPGALPRLAKQCRIPFLSKQKGTINTNPNPLSRISQSGGGSGHEPSPSSSTPKSLETLSAWRGRPSYHHCCCTNAAGNGHEKSYLALGRWYALSADSTTPNTYRRRSPFPATCGVWVSYLRTRNRSSYFCSCGVNNLMLGETHITARSNLTLDQSVGTEPYLRTCIPRSGGSTLSNLEPLGPTVCRRELPVALGKLASLLACQNEYLTAEIELETLCLFPFGGRCSV